VMVLTSADLIKLFAPGQPGDTAIERAVEGAITNAFLPTYMTFKLLKFNIFFIFLSLSFFSILLLLLSSSFFFFSSSFFFFLFFVFLLYLIIIFFIVRMKRIFSIKFIKTKSIYSFYSTSGFFMSKFVNLNLCNFYINYCQYRSSPLKIILQL